jgi:cation diffusion facilitator CzcD-associated flavoprotein CzcO
VPAHAHTAVSPGFPNFFMMMGPHSPVGNYSVVAIAETQAEHITDWITQWRARRFDMTSPTDAATAQLNSDMRAAMPNTTWVNGCTLAARQGRFSGSCRAHDSWPYGRVGGVCW